MTRAPDPWDPEDDPPGTRAGDLLEGGMRPPGWRRGWDRLSRPARLLLVALTILLAAGAVGLELRERAVERAVAERVDLTASMGLSSLSATPPGGQVSFFLVVRNEGALPVWVTSVAGSADGLRLRASDEVERQVSPGGEAAIPVSVRLTCAEYGGADDLSARLAVRRADGGSVARRVRPASAEALSGIASTLCAVRPDLVDQELSGPVLAGPEEDGPTR